MTPLVSATTYRVQFLSPVHIGTGDRLGVHDFLVVQGKLYRLDAGRLLSELEQAPQIRDQYFTEGLPAIERWLRQGDRLKRLSLYESPVPRPARPREDLRPFLADPLGRPYLPGTELKGAVRTAILWSLVSAYSDKGHLSQRVGHRLNRQSQREPQRDRRFAGQWLEQTLLGEDPRTDALRMLRVTDSTPAPASVLRAYPVLVAGRQHEGLGLMEQPRSGDRPSRYAQDTNRAVANFCECLEGTATDLRCQVGLDQFLLQKWNTDVSFLTGWIEACNTFARSVAETEQNWWNEVQARTPSSLQPMAKALGDFYVQLRRTLLALPQGAAVLNVGWGGGWRTKTVTEPLGNESVRAIVRRYKLDRGSGSWPFPKTRKVAWLGGQNFAPLGWVLLVPV